MADLNKINAVKNGNVTFAASAGASTQTIPITKDEKMAIYVNNASASAVTATVVKGNGICSVQGDLAVTVPASSAMLIGPLESARFVDTTTGKYTLNLSATSSVTVAAIQL
jgi:uncharacterized protein (UPF0210 family)